MIIALAVRYDVPVVGHVACIRRDRPGRHTCVRSGMRRYRMIHRRRSRFALGHQSSHGGACVKVRLLDRRQRRESNFQSGSALVAPYMSAKCVSPPRVGQLAVVMGPARTRDRNRRCADQRALVWMLPLVSVSSRSNRYNSVITSVVLVHHCTCTSPSRRAKATCAPGGNSAVRTQHCGAECLVDARKIRRSRVGESTRGSARQLGVAGHRKRQFVVFRFHDSVPLAHHFGQI